MPLKIAAKVDAVDREYFAEVIEPRIKPPMIEYIGEIDDVQKSEFLGGALALLFTIDWPEPFGLAMIEALACGTPVIARPCGACPKSSGRASPDFSQAKSTNWWPRWKGSIRFRESDAGASSKSALRPK